MANAPEVEATCGPLVAGGDSLIRREGEKVLFIEGGIPGERVRVVIDRERKDLANGRVTQVLEPSANRIEPPCPMFRAGCGGCQWQHMATPSQHDAKVGIVTDSLTRIAKVKDVPITFGGAVPDFGYRTTMHLAVNNGKAALRRRRTNDEVPLDLCLIADPALSELIAEGWFGSADSVTLRVSQTTGERIALVRGNIDGVRLPSDVVITPNGKNVSMVEEVDGRRYRISARSFFQDGPAAATLLAQTVNAAALKDAEWIVDLYAGVGVLGGNVADERDAHLTSVEQDKSALIDARMNLRDLDAEVIDAEVATVSLSGESQPDVVIADPSRTGLGRSASRTVAGLGAEQIILVSCDPASLARDVNLLHNEGYTLENVSVLDLFPQTHHVETVSTFTR